MVREVGPELFGTMGWLDDPTVAAIEVPVEVLWALNSVVRAAELATKTGNAAALTEPLAALRGLRTLAKVDGAYVAETPEAAFTFGFAERIFCRRCEQPFGWTRTPRTGLCGRCPADS